MSLEVSISSYSKYKVRKWWVKPLPLKFGPNKKFKVRSDVPFKDFIRP